jgi:hypothetical protein
MGNANPVEWVPGADTSNPIRGRTTDAAIWSDEATRFNTEYMGEFSEPTSESNQEDSILPFHELYSQTIPSLEEIRVRRFNSIELGPLPLKVITDEDTVRYPTRFSRILKDEELL